MCRLILGQDGADMSTNVYLVQVSGHRSTHGLGAERWADEPLKLGLYGVWRSGQGKKIFRQIQKGDYVLLYCTGNVDEYPNQIRHIYEVVERGGILDEHDKLKERVVWLKTHRLLRRGLERQTIHVMAKKGDLSPNMMKCGGHGFNVYQVEWKDYLRILEWDKNQNPQIAVQLSERELSDYILGMRILELIPEYRGYELHRNTNGKIGVRYKIDGGEVDLLFHKKKTDDLLVVELKVGEIEMKHTNQVKRYVDRLRRQNRNKGSVFGLLVGRHCPGKLKSRIEELESGGIRVATYAINLEVNLRESAQL
ncbi:MAG: DUF1016 family protein [Methanomassiliicoccales archaeon]|nr:MAG: DUF1016 family protein [Methanomassiliicoccales archaeon]